MVFRCPRLAFLIQLNPLSIGQLGRQNIVWRVLGHFVTAHWPRVTPKRVIVNAKLGISQISVHWDDRETPQVRVNG